MTRKILVDLRMGGKVSYYIGDPEQRLMLIDDEIRKCVAFVGCTTPNGFKLAGTVFFISVPLDAENLALYAITARHVIVAANRESEDKRILLKVNSRDGGPKLLATSFSDWSVHSDPYVDVAVYSFSDWQGLDFRTIGSESLATASVMQQQGIGIGEEIFLVGLFSEHAGKKKNIPIVRVGNIAAMPEEQIETKMGRDIVNIDAYLVECKSIGGLSGSPVFVHIDAKNQVPWYYLTPPPPSPTITYLLGLMHGHWEFPSSKPDTLKLDEARGDSVNVGIAIVIPCKRSSRF